MGKYSEEMWTCIRDIDHETAMRLWKHMFPAAPQPENDYQAIFMLHYARAKSPTMPEGLRLYSHCWLRDEGVPSLLPDRLKPKAERMYPVGVRAVGVSSGKIGGEKTSFNIAVQGVMRNAAEEAYADGHANQPHIVKGRILEKRAEFKRRA